MGWQSLTDAGLENDLGIRWARAGDATALQGDPYLFWAALTGFRTYGPAQRPGLRLGAFELCAGVAGQAFLQAVKDANQARWLEGLGPMMQIAPHHVNRLLTAPTEPGCRFVGWVHVESLASSPLCALIHRYRIALVGTTEGLAPAAAWPSAAGASMLPVPAALQASTAPTPATTPAQASTQPIVGIIDIGCAFAHPRVARASAAGWCTRVTHLWDMGRAADLGGGGLWQDCADFGYGRETDEARLNDLIVSAIAAHGHQGKPGNSEVERMCYQSAGMPELLSERKRWSHGTMVMDFAAGADPDVQQPDLAAGADIVFVQLPPDAVEDLSCGWLTAHVIDAVHFILAKAAGRQAVINLSFGAYAGSHDGESLLEQALDAFAKQSDTMLVLSAGNARGKGMHAFATIPKKGSADLQWVVPRDDSTQSFVELWYEAKHRPGTPDACHLTVTLTHSDLPTMPAVEGAAAAWFVFDHAPQSPVAAVLQVPGTRSGGRDGMVLLAIGPTDRESALARWDPVRAPSGYWTISVSNPGDCAVKVHAWVERDDPDLAARSEFAQSRLVAVERGFVVDDSFTLTGQACGARTVVVGSRVENDPNLIACAPDSSEGPARRGDRQGPDLLAAGVRRAPTGLVGVKAVANLSGGQPARLSGTSISAPRVTRSIFNLLASGAVTGGVETVLGYWFAVSEKPPSTAHARPPPLSSRDPRVGLGVLDDKGDMLSVPTIERRRIIKDCKTSSE